MGMRSKSSPSAFTIKTNAATHHAHSPAPTLVVQSDSGLPLAGNGSYITGWRSGSRVSRLGYATSLSDLRPAPDRPEAER